eukprot:TRINITY_DN3178_c0_g1_i1.p1 TRINITY_DN3178_c0_g1~~TRINITY_DN3178_c0_g1_i1.p1  ORF type:complete len:382 (+),score=103.41 TRINITY_DN3178_c0_g1_i1:600-1745(+)
MDYIPGMSLKEFAKREDSKKSLRCMLELANSIGWLDAYNIHHWDLHSENIIVAENGSPTVIDLEFTWFGNEPTSKQIFARNEYAFWDIFEELYCSDWDLEDWILKPKTRPSFGQLLCALNKSVGKVSMVFEYGVVIRKTFEKIEGQELPELILHVPRYPKETDGWMNEAVNVIRKGIKLPERIGLGNIKHQERIEFVIEYLTKANLDVPQLKERMISYLKELSDLIKNGNDALLDFVNEDIEPLIENLEDSGYGDIEKLEDISIFDIINERGLLQDMIDIKNEIGMVSRTSFKEFMIIQAVDSIIEKLTDQMEWRRNYLKDHGEPEHWEWLLSNAESDLVLDSLADSDISIVGKKMIEKGMDSYTGAIQFFKFCLCSRFHD